MPRDNRFCTDWLGQAAQQQPGASALILQDANFDYAALRSRTAQFCQVLGALGLKPGATIAVASRSAGLLAFLLHAALLADYVLFPLDPRLPDRQRRRLLELAGADLLVSENDAVPRNPGLKFMAAARLLTRARQAKPMSAAKPPVRPDRPRLLLATSGSSGLPKLVKLSDNNLQASVQAANQVLQVSRASVWLDCLPLVHVGGLSILLRCVRAGASVVLREGFDAPAVANDLHNYQVSHVSLVPTMLAQLLEFARRPPPGLQVALVGGAPLEPTLARRALASGWPVWVSYGLTETASMLTARRLCTEHDNPQQVGGPLPGFELRTVDEAGRPVVGQGVVQVRGEAVHDRGNRPAGQWFTTGDRGQLDKAGRLTLLGRTDSMLLSGGEKVHPELVEQLLANYPGIEDVAVTGRADPLWGERVVAVYCGDIDEAALAQLCRNGIQGAMRPRVFIKVECLPRTPNGKLDRAALRAMVVNRH